MECDGNIAVYYLVDAERGDRFCVLRDCGIPLLNDKLSAHPSAHHSRSRSPQTKALEQDTGGIVECSRRNTSLMCTR
ncbi:hypothetical protein GCK32_016666 [Trichostrongylus colubriformis]|uniref:Uncharacterized protein n=1 Tax=Trichostrongylus colubriformis TaxID=6319 RepID=A0AAN8FCP8_TRICO